MKTVNFPAPLVILTYELYNEGWILETIERDREGNWDFEILDTDDIIEDIQDITGHQDDSAWSSSVEFVNVIDKQFPEYSNNPFEVLYTVELYFF